MQFASELEPWEVKQHQAKYRFWRFSLGELKKGPFVLCSAFTSGYLRHLGLSSNSNHADKVHESILENKNVTNMNCQIVPLQPEDWPQVRLIYEESISTGVSTFDTKSPNWKDWDSGRLSSCRFVARKGKTVFGWGSLSPVSST